LLPQVDLYGALTLAEERRMLEQIKAAAAVPAFPAQKERVLLDAVGKNPYEKSLLLVEMAAMRSDRAEQARSFRAHIV
jgi:hypothetical protein